MLKKWFLILLSAWLVNSVVWYQTPSTVDINASTSEGSRTCLIELSSLLGTAVHLLDEDNDCSKHSHRIKFRNHFLMSRVSAAVALVPTRLSFLFKNIPTTLIKIPNGKYNVTSCFLPGYYSFLFRLSPF